MPTPTDGWIRANDLSLHYLDWGSPGGPAVLFLHGGSAHARWWDLVIAALADRYRCIALDLRGHGDSGRPAGGEYDLASHVADVAAVSAELDLHGSALVGHSFGGYVAMAYAGRGDVALGALAVVDSQARISPRSVRFLEALGKLPQPRYADLDDAVARFRLLPAGTSAAPAVLAHAARHSVVRLASGTWTLKFDRRALTGTAAQELTPYLSAAPCPVLAVRGARSAIVDAAALAEFASARPDAELAEIPEAYHHVMLDQPAALAAVLGDFLARHLPGAQGASRHHR